MVLVSIFKNHLNAGKQKGNLFFLGTVLQAAALVLQFSIFSGLWDSNYLHKISKDSV